MNRRGFLGMLAASPIAAALPAAAAPAPNPFVTRAGTAARFVGQTSFSVGLMYDGLKVHQLRDGEIVSTYDHPQAHHMVMPLDDGGSLRLVAS